MVFRKYSIDNISIPYTDLIFEVSFYVSVYEASLPNTCSS